MHPLNAAAAALQVAVGPDAESTLDVAKTLKDKQ